MTLGRLLDQVAAGVGETLTLPVVMVVDGENVTASGLDQASVTAEVLGGTKGPKIVIQKYKNKTGYKKRQGHRQKYTQVKITSINVPGLEVVADDTADPPPASDAEDTTADEQPTDAVETAAEDAADSGDE